jgi:hypothetical protein
VETGKFWVVGDLTEIQREESKSSREKSILDDQEAEERKLGMEW